MSAPAGIGGFRFSCDDERLAKGFAWASAQALAYAFEGDPVGEWYEAALPGRAAFCMRDAAHQAAGAQALGLMRHNKNMLRKFARGIAESRDFCSFWEIDRLGRPAPVDYVSDEDFWYNLPANFDVTDACWRMYRWTGDREYIEGADFTRFYDLTATRYVEAWDADGDGLMERTRVGSRRGIPSYDEDIGHSHAVTMLDLAAIQARGYDSYAAICRERGMAETAAGYEAKARALRRAIHDKWWDGESGSFFDVRLRDGSLAHAPNFGTAAMPAYYGGITDGKRLEAELDRLDGLRGLNVEGMSYLPGAFYRYGQCERAQRWLLRMTDPGLGCREYPEVSYCAVGYFAQGLMGVEPQAHLNRVDTTPGLAGGVASARIEGLPVFGGTISVEHAGGGSAFANGTRGAILWKARFPGEARSIAVDGALKPAERETDELGHIYSCTVVECPRGATRRADPVR